MTQPYYSLKVMLESLMESEASLKENPPCQFNLAFDSEVTRSCDKIIDIIKLEVTLWL